MFKSQMMSHLFIQTVRQARVEAACNIWNSYRFDMKAAFKIIILKIELDMNKLLFVFVTELSIVLGRAHGGS